MARVGLPPDRPSVRSDHASVARQLFELGQGFERQIRGVMRMYAGRGKQHPGMRAREFNGFERRVRTMARHDAKAQLLMSTPGVGAIVGLTYASAIDDPARFKSSKQVGAHFGMTPKKYQSGETDVSGRISKIGDAGVRTALYEAAHIILTRPVKGCGLKSWAARLAKRAGMKKAKVALARKLAVILHRMWVDGTSFVFTASNKPAATAA